MFPQVDDVKFVVDSMLAKLGKKLRSCGIDTVFSVQYTYEDMIDIARQDNRIVLTRGKWYARICKYLAHGQVHYIRANDTPSQLKEVLQRYRIRVQPSNLFARCVICNGSAYAARSAEFVATLPDQGKVPTGIIDRFQAEQLSFYQCTVCQKFYWEGAHIGRAFDSFFESILPGSVVPHARKMWGLDVGDAPLAAGDDPAANILIGE